MFRQYVRRGVVAGAVAGVAFGAGAAATADAPAHLHHALLPPAAATLLAGALWGMVLGTAFGGAFFLLEPWLAGRNGASEGNGGGDGRGGRGTSVGALAAAGVLTVSGAPWLVLPPGVESTLPAAARVGWYAAAMVAGAVAALVALAAARRHLALAPVPLAALVALASLGPSPSGVAALGAWLDAPGVVAGQVGLWTVLAAVYGRLHHRDGASPVAGGDAVRSAD